jgi:transcriptional regulator with XRE-family HTH domain
MDLGKAIRKLREEKELTQEDLGKLAELTQTSISQIEASLTRPSEKNLGKISRALEVPVALIQLYALDETDIPESKKDIFKELFPSIKKVIKEIVSDN